MERSTVCALATPHGRSAIGVIRVTGPQTEEIIRKIFKPITSKDPFLEKRNIVNGYIIDENGDLLDRVILLFFRNPGSYTGEDLAEIHCHGNPVVLKLVLHQLYHNGCEPAAPGEFTKRAFLNGKMGLDEAEVVHSIVEARGEKELQNIYRQQNQQFNKKVSVYRSSLLNLLADITAELDFGDEDIEFVSREDIISETTLVVSELKQILADSRRIQHFKQNFEIVILGSPNAGKSSLMNRLSGRDRSIVSDTPGTTRDFLSSEVILDGVPVELVDTAGIRSEAGDATEKAGIEIAMQRAAMADLLLVVIDQNDPTETSHFTALINAILVEKTQSMKMVQGDQYKNSRKVMVLLNKWDLLSEQDPGEKRIKEWGRVYTDNVPPENRLFQDPIKNFLPVSAKTGLGLEELIERINQAIDLINPHSDSLSLAQWQIDILEKSIVSVEESIEMISQGELQEIIVAKLNEAVDLIGNLTGEITSEDLLGRIFSRFCIGK